MGGNEMTQKNQKVCCSPAGMEENCCRVESIISIDERGQMVLPKELGDRASLRAGDKLAIISWDKGGEVCCIYLIKAEHL
jgi:antitoxin PrlF